MRTEIVSDVFFAITTHSRKKGVPWLSIFGMLTLCRRGFRQPSGSPSVGLYDRYDLVQRFQCLVMPASSYVYLCSSPSRSLPFPRLNELGHSLYLALYRQSHSFYYYAS